MKLLNTNGREYSVQPLEYIRNNDDIIGKSKGHLLARRLIKECFPIDWVLEEVPVKIAKQTLYADFLIKGRQVVVEVQGSQHEQFSPFFHETKAKFSESKIRDARKKNWCELNGFTLIELPYGESENEWRTRLCQ